MDTGEEGKKAKKMGTRLSGEERKKNRKGEGGGIGFCFSFDKPTKKKQK